MLSESIHLRAITFFLDIYPEHFQIIYRNFPELWCKTIEDVIIRIGAIENGTEDYFWDKLADIAVTNSPGFIETMKNDLKIILDKSAYQLWDLF